MKAGIKFCGGCNPRYDRGAYAEELKKNPDYETEYAKEGVHYDVLHVVCGCTAACARYQQYDADEVRKYSDNSGTPLEVIR